MEGWNEQDEIAENNATTETHWLDSVVALDEYTPTPSLSRTCSKNWK